MAALTPVVCARTGGGAAATLSAAGGGGDTMPSGPAAFLRVKNGNAAVCNVTVTPPAGSGPNGTTIAPFVLTPGVEASTGERIYGPFPQNPFGDANGNINFSYSVTTTVTVQALLMSS